MFDNMNVQETLGESDREDRDDRKAILTIALSRSEIRLSLHGSARYGLHEHLSFRRL